MVLQFVVRHIEFVGANAPAHRYPGGVYAVGIAGYQRMPPVEVMALGQQYIGAGRRKPFDLFEAFGRQPDAIIDQVQPAFVIAAAAAVSVEESATNVGVKGLDS